MVFKFGEVSTQKGKQTTFPHHTKEYIQNGSNLYVRPKSIKIPEENIGLKVSDIAHSNFFIRNILQAREIKERINKWDYFKLKRFITAKENINKI